jgi:hypothetical protein
VACRDVDARSMPMTISLAERPLPVAAPSASVTFADEWTRPERATR